MVAGLFDDAAATEIYATRTIASALVAMVEHFAYCWAVLGEDHDRDAAVEALVLIWGSTLNEIAGFPVVRPAGG